MQNKKYQVDHQVIKEDNQKLIKTYLPKKGNLGRAITITEVTYSELTKE